MSKDGCLTICQISDIHCGSAYFIADLLERSILEINDTEPTAVVVSGDFTDAGYRQEFEQAAEYLRRFRCENLMVISASTTPETLAIYTSSSSSGNATRSSSSKRRSWPG